MSGVEKEGLRGQVTRVAVWAGILAATVGFWSATGALLLRLFR